MKLFSLNHDSIGTRHSGSYNRPDDWEDNLDNDGSYWAKSQGQTLRKWRETAEVGDTYYVGISVYEERVE